MVKSIEDYRVKGTIKDIAPNEKQAYLTFLEETYNDNLNVSEFLLIKFPRWSIISGYYAMHDISKLLLAKRYNMKISKPETHTSVIVALRELIKRKEIISLIEKAEEEYIEIVSLHLSLLKGKEEREKSQYYTSSLIKPAVKIEKAAYFMEKLVKPYIKIIKNLMKNDN